MRRAEDEQLCSGDLLEQSHFLVELSFRRRESKIFTLNFSFVTKQNAKWQFRFLIREKNNSLAHN